MKSLMSLLMVGGLLVVGAAAMGADKPFSGFKNRGESGPQVKASLGAPQSSADYAYENALPPAPAGEAAFVPPQPVPEGASLSSMGAAPMPVAQGAPVELYSCVEYKHKHEIHPCPVEMIVSVKDPCACDDPCSCCAPKCVNVIVCAPPCGCPEIKCSKDGSRVKYDYGKYGFEVTSRKGVVTVKYDD